MTRRFPPPHQPGEYAHDDDTRDVWMAIGVLAAGMPEDRYRSGLLDGLCLGAFIFLLFFAVGAVVLS